MARAMFELRAYRMLKVDEVELSDDSVFARKFKTTLPVS
jgi:hypothetical protein